MIHNLKTIVCSPEGLQKRIFYAEGNFRPHFLEERLSFSDHQSTLCDTVFLVTDCNIWPCWRSLVRSARGLLDSRQDRSWRKWAFCAGFIHCPLTKEIEAFVRKGNTALCYQDEASFARKESH